MANRALFRDRRKNPWGKFTARLSWEGGGHDSLWVDENGVAEFNGTGVIDYVDAAGEKIVLSLRVNGDSTFSVVSRNNH